MFESYGHITLLKCLRLIMTFWFKHSGYFSSFPQPLVPRWVMLEEWTKQRFKNVRMPFTSGQFHCWTEVLDWTNCRNSIALHKVEIWCRFSKWKLKNSKTEGLGETGEVPHSAYIGTVSGSNLFGLGLNVLGKVIHSNRRPSAWEAHILTTGGVNKLLKNWRYVYILYILLSDEKTFVCLSVILRVGHIFLQNAPTKSAFGEENHKKERWAIRLLRP